MGTHETACRERLMRSPEEQGARKSLPRGSDRLFICAKRTQTHRETA